MSTLQIYRNVMLAGASAALLVSVGACSRDNGFSAGAGSGGGVASTAGSGSTTTAAGDTGAAAGGTDGTGASAGASGSGSSAVASNGSGSSTGSTGSGTTGSGSGSGTGTTSADGTVARVANAATGTTGGALVTTGNALLDTPAAGAGATVAALGSSLQSNGLAAVPVAGKTLASTVATADGAINPNAKVVVLNAPLAGSSASGSQQLYGVSALSPTVTGANATVGVLNNGVPSASTTTGLVRADTVQNVSVGQNGSNLVGASVLSPASPQGSVATVNLHPSTLSQPVAGLSNPTGGVSLANATAAVPGTATSLVSR